MNFLQEQDLPGFFTGRYAVATLTSGFLSAPVWCKVMRKVGEGEGKEYSTREVGRAGKGTIFCRS